MKKPEGEVRLVQSDSIPFAVDLHLQTYEGMGWIKRYLRGQSGWLQVGRATMDTYWGRWSATLVVAVTDKGEVLNKTVSRALLEMRSANPREPDDTPDDDIDGHMEMAYWDFLGRCDIRHLKMLDEAEAEMAGRVEAEQARGEAVLAEVELYLSQLSRQRRSATSDAVRDAIMARIALLEQKHQEAAAWLVRRLAAMRLEGEQLETDLLESLQNHGQLEIIQTIHWVARHNGDKREAVEQASSFWRRDGTAEDWRSSISPSGALDRAQQLGTIVGRLPVTAILAEKRERFTLVADLTIPRPGEDALEKLSRISRAWIKEDSKKASEVESRPKPAASDLRTPAQKKSAQRGIGLDKRDAEVANLIEQFKTVAELDRQLDLLPGVSTRNRRLARLIRHAIRQLDTSADTPAPSSTAVTTFPDCALVRTTMDELVPAAVTDSIDIDAQIDMTLRDMLKDLR